MGNNCDFSHLPNITDIYFHPFEGHGKIDPANLAGVEMLHVQTYFDHHNAAHWLRPACA
jgi:hypothetical protein